MKRSSLIVIALTLLLVGVSAGCVWPFDGATPAAAPSLQFSADFSSASDFYDRFDYGYSGQNPHEFTDPNNGGIVHYHGDHDATCAGPTTLRDVNLGGDKAHLDYSQMFWSCLPGGDPAKGHIMTGVNTVGYNIAWFSPKPAFTNVTQVCWDINETDMSRRKWTQVLFLDDADAHRYPVTPNETAAPHAPNGALMPHRGSGGFDLGYVSPEFSDTNGATDNIISGGIDGQHQTLAGFKLSYGLTPEWFQNGGFTTPTWGGAGGVKLTGNTDKAARYQQCLSNQPNNVVRLVQALPGGNSRTIDMPGQIPSGSRKVVFEDDNYNPPKDEPPENPDGTYNADVLTWHWDNIQVFTNSSTPPTTPPPTTTPPTTTPPTTTPPTTTPPTTTPPTTTPPTTTPPTTTPPTTTPPTTTPPTTTPPTTTPPTTTPPTTTPPTTTPPTTTPPTTTPPTTTPPTTTPPTTTPPTTTPPTTTPPTTTDPTPPSVTITSGPDGPTPDVNARFTFRIESPNQKLDAPVSSRFLLRKERAWAKCSLDGGPGWWCLSPVSIRHLTPGRHELVVTAVAKGVSSSDSRVWYVLTPGQDPTRVEGVTQTAPAPPAVAAAASPAAPVAARSVLSFTGAHSIQLAAVGLMMIALGLALGSIARIARRRAD